MLTLYLTPGHTLGTISTLIPVKDGGTPHLAAEWGGTGFNWIQNREDYITPSRSRIESRPHSSVPFLGWGSYEQCATAESDSLGLMSSGCDKRIGHVRLFETLRPQPAAVTAAAWRA